MANSWNGPKLGSPIRTDVPELQKKLIALLKQDPTSVANIPSGAKRLVNTSGVQWQVQQYNGSSWAAIGKLMHDVDKLDGYHAAITPAASTIAVRNADKKLEGDITGNAATASSATTLSETLPVNKGGTGATTSAAARTNLGVPPTSHASSGTAYGLGSNLNYGHVRGDGETTDVVAGEVVAKDIAIGGDSAKLASMFGQIGRNFSLPDDIDIDTVLTPGLYGVRGVTAKNTPTSSWGFLQVVNGYSKSDSTITQIWVNISNISDQHIYIRGYVNPSWSPWRKTILNEDFATKSSAGIVQPGDGLKAGNKGLVGVDDTVVRTSGNQSISGEKVFSYSLVSTANTLLRTQKGDISISDTSRQKQTNIMLAVVEDKDLKRFAGLEVTSSLDGSRSMQFAMRNRADTGWLVGVRFKELVDGTSFCEAPTPGEDSNTNHIATTEWVRSYTIPTGALIPSLAASMTGYLLCNGAAVSRTTYANLFSIIGTKFGAGDGSTTFNLPDFRNRVFWGANGNLMSILAAGLPNITGNVFPTAYPAGDPYGTPIGGDGAFKTVTNRSDIAVGKADYIGTGYYPYANFDASRSSTIYGKSTTVQPPAIAVNIFIKY